MLGAGAASVAVAAMKAHADSVGVLAQGVGALGNLAGGDAEGQRAVIDAGGAAAVVAVLQASGGDAEEAVQRGGRAALANMAFGDEALREAVLATGAEPVWLE